MPNFLSALIYPFERREFRIEIQNDDQDDDQDDDAKAKALYLKYYLHAAAQSDTYYREQFYKVNFPAFMMVSSGVIAFFSKNPYGLFYGLLGIVASIGFSALMQNFFKEENHVGKVINAVHHIQDLHSIRHGTNTFPAQRIIVQHREYFDQLYPTGNYWSTQDRNEEHCVEAEMRWDIPNEFDDIGICIDNFINY